MELLGGQEIEKKLLATNYIDSELKDLHYDHNKHLVTMKYMGSSDDEVEEREYILLFKECFSANFNTWLKGAKGHVPQSPSESVFFFHDITITETHVEGIHLYKVNIIIPMMDCQLTCKSIAIVRGS